MKEQSMITLLFLSLFFQSSTASVKSCLICETTIGTLIAFLNSTDSEAKIEHAIDLFCEILPEHEKEQCVHLAHTVANFLVQLPKLTKDQDYSPFALCSMYDYCTVKCCLSGRPEQVHLSLGDRPGVMNVVWTMMDRVDGVVYYGESMTGMGMEVRAKSHTYTSGGWKGWIYVAEMIGLKPGSQYYYKVGNNDTGYSQTFNFFTERPYVENDPTKIIMYGDMGVSHASDQMIERIQKIVASHGNDLIIHDGDISYADGFQQRWDIFMRKIEKIAAFTPYMVAPGNHEIGIIGLLNTTLGYPYRFSLPGEHALGPDLENMYYSWDYRNIHFISIDTESIEDTALVTAQQLSWLENDLQSVDRKVHPWIVVYGHRPLYCSNNGNDCGNGFFAFYLREKLEPLFHKYHVDIVFTAHKHDYERMWPVYQSKPSFSYNNPRETTYVLNGAGGNREGVTHFPSPRPSYSASAISEWGYGVLTVYNNTVLTWEFITAENNEVADTFTLVSDHLY